MFTNAAALSRGCWPIRAHDGDVMIGNANLAMLDVDGAMAVYYAGVMVEAARQGVLPDKQAIMVNSSLSFC